MEVIISWVKELIQTTKLKLFFAQFDLLDVYVLLFILMGFVYGMKKGFLRMIIELLEMLILMCFVIGNYQSFTQILRGVIMKLPEAVALPISYFFILSVIWASILILDSIARKWIHAETIVPLRVIGGGGLGMLYFFLIFSFLSKGLSLLPIQSVEKLYSLDQSSMGPYLVNLPGKIHAYIIHIFVTLLSGG